MERLSAEGETWQIRLVCPKCSERERCRNWRKTSSCMPRCDFCNAVFQTMRFSQGRVCARVPAMTTQLDFNSKVFEKKVIQIGDQKEAVVVGGRHLFPLLPKAFAGVKQIGVIGWGSQGPAQAQNLRESLEGTGIKVKIGLRPGSASAKSANEAGFTEQNGTLGEMNQVIAESD